MSNIMTLYITPNLLQTPFLRGVIADLLSRHSTSCNSHGRLLEGNVAFQTKRGKQSSVDSTEMFKEKMFHFSKLVKFSQRTVVVIDSEFFSSSLSVFSSPSSFHKSLVSLEKAGIIQTVISLDHWSLLQKAGYLQVVKHIHL